jgi:xanthine dehydrogenase small subunit
MRASSAYRMKIARNLLWRFHLETREKAPLSLAEVDAFVFGDDGADLADQSAGRDLQ